MKQIVLCADDFGQAAAVNEAIVELATLKRISALSVLVTGQDWLEGSKRLMALPPEFDIGLHLNFTEGVPASIEFKRKYGACFAWGRALGRAIFTRRLDLIQKECLAQFKLFKTMTGKLPTFIDGHHHVHLFPGVQEVVIELALKEVGRGAYIRHVYDHFTAHTWTHLAKKFVLNSLGKSFESKLKQHHLPHNQWFAGLYDFADAKNYRQYFIQFMKHSPPHGGLMMCHPGLYPAHGTSMMRARYQEYCYLKSPVFVEDCHENGVEIVPMRALGANDWINRANSPANAIL